MLRGIGGEAAFSARYREQSQDLRHTGVHVARTESFLFSAEILLPGMFVTAATWIAAHYALHGLITPGQLVTFYAYTSFLALPLATLTEAADKIVRGHVAACLPGGDRHPGAAASGDPISLIRPGWCAAPGPGAAPPCTTRLGLTATPPASSSASAAADPPGRGRRQLADRIGRYLPGQAMPGQPAGPLLGGVPIADLPVATLRSRSASSR